MKALSMLGVTIFVTSSAFAAVNSGDVLSDSKQSVRAGIYKSMVSVNVDPEAVGKNGQLFTNLDEYHLSQDEAVSVFPTADGYVSVIFAPSDEEAGVEANQLLFTQEQFAQLNLKFDKEGGPEKLQDYPNFDILPVAKHGGGKTGGEIRKRSHKGRSGGYGGCVLAVVRRFGAVGVMGNGVGAVNAYKAAQPNLWMDASASSAIPHKTICSYSGGPRGKGDVATYVGSGRWEYRTSGKTHALEMSGFTLQSCITHI